MTVINFWAPWCEACKHEVPALAKLARERPGLRVVGVSAEVEKLDLVRAFAKEHGLHYPIRLATDAAVAAFFGQSGKMALPATFVFDAEGVVRRSWFRAIDEAELTATLDALHHPPSAEELADLAEYMPERTPDRAISLMREAVAASPASGLYRFRLGKLLLDERRFEECEAPLREAVRLSPEEDEFEGALAYCLLRGGRVEEARLLLLEALKRQPGSAFLWLNIGHVDLREGRTEKAVFAWRRSLELRPGQPEVWKQLAAALAKLGRPGEAEAARAEYEALVGRRSLSGGR